MDLSSYLVKQFAAITNDTVKKSDGATVYGTVQIIDNVKYAIIDGSDVLTPISSTVTISEGDRVVISLKNHTATVTGNLSDPSASSIIVDAMGIHLKGLVSFESLANGTTTIDGSCIKTGTIDAKRLNLTGAITFEDLATDAQEAIANATPVYQYSVNGVTNWHEVMSDDDLYRRESTDGGVTWGVMYQFRGTDGSDANLPNYIKSTYIDGDSVSSPVLRGGIISGVVFSDLNQKTSLQLNPNNSNTKNADLALYSGNNLAYEIYDTISGGIYFKVYGEDFLYTANNSGNRAHTYPQGTWNFSEATVKGITAVFA